MWTIGLKATVPHWLLASLPSILAIWSSLKWQFISQSEQIEKERRKKCQRERERESTSKVELKVFCNLIMKVICHHFWLHSLP